MSGESKMKQMEKAVDYHKWQVEQLADYDEALSFFLRQWKILPQQVKALCS